MVGQTSTLYINMPIVLIDLIYETYENGYLDVLIDK